MADRAAAEAEIRRAVEGLNRRLASYETIKRYAVLERDFTEETGELTPSLKVKRKAVFERYKDQIESLYAESAGTPAEASA
jgi:long-chain acyl-CoA synthetase